MSVKWLFSHVEFLNVNGMWFLDLWKFHLGLWWPHGTWGGTQRLRTSDSVLPAPKEQTLCSLPPRSCVKRLEQVWVTHLEECAQGCNVMNPKCTALRGMKQRGTSPGKLKYSGFTALYLGGHIILREDLRLLQGQPSTCEKTGVLRRFGPRLECQSGTRVDVCPHFCCLHLGTSPKQGVGAEQLGAPGEEKVGAAGLCSVVRHR